MKTRKIGRSISCITIIVLFVVMIVPAIALGSQKLLEQQVPVKTFTDYTNKEVRIEEGKIAIVYFWQTSCAPCSAMIPLLNKLFDDYSDKGFTVIGIGPGESARSTEKYKNDKGPKYNLIPDQAGKVSMAFGITVTPSIYIVDGTGTVVQFKTGYKQSLDDAFYEGNIRQLLGLK